MYKIVSIKYKEMGWIHYEMIKKVISMVVIFSLVLCSCSGNKRGGRDTMRVGSTPPSQSHPEMMIVVDGLGQGDSVIVEAGKDINGDSFKKFNCKYNDTNNTGACTFGGRWIGVAGVEISVPGEDPVFYGYRGKAQGGNARELKCLFDPDSVDSPEKCTYIKSKCKLEDRECESPEAKITTIEYVKNDCLRGFKGSDGYKRKAAEKVYDSVTGPIAGRCPIVGSKKEEIKKRGEIASKLKLKLKKEKKCNDDCLAYYEVADLFERVLDGTIDNLEKALAEFTEIEEKSKQEKEKLEEVMWDLYHNFSGNIRRQRSVIRGYINGEVKLENFPKEFEEAKKKDAEEQKAVTEIYKKLNYLRGINDYWKKVKIEKVRKKIADNEIPVENFQAELKKLEKRIGEIEAVIHDYEAGKYGSGGKVKSLMTKVLTINEETEEMSENLLVKLKEARKEDEKARKEAEEEMADQQKMADKCPGELVFQEKDGEFKSYCYKKEDLLDLLVFYNLPGTLKEEVLETGRRKCINFDNIFYSIDEWVEMRTFVPYCNLGELVPGSSAKLSKRQQDEMRIVAAKQKATEECKTQDEAFRKFLDENKDKESYETDPEYLKLLKNTKNCSEYRRAFEEWKKARQDDERKAEAKKLKFRLKERVIDSYISDRNNSPMAVFDRVMSLCSNYDEYHEELCREDIIRPNYKVFMQEDLDVNMSLKEAQLELAAKIAEEYCEKKEALKIKELFNKFSK